MNISRARRFKTLISSTVIAIVLAVGLTVTFVDAQRTITGPTRPQTGSGSTGGGAASEEPGSGTSTGTGSSGTSTGGSGTTTTTTPENLLSGYAWSTNVGWIRMSNCTSPTDCSGQNYGVSVATSGTTRAMSGYGWSPYIGWVSFNSSATAGCPSGSCQASVDWASGKISGWARACSVLANGDCSASGGMVSDTQRGGWDGFIALRSGATGAEFGVKLDTTSGNFAGQAWGSDVVGWVDFTGVKLINPECKPGDDCYCTTHPDDTVNCPQCPVGSECYCHANPGDTENCPNNCPVGSVCYCTQRAHMNEEVCTQCGVKGSKCWCTRNQSDPEYARYCDAQIDMCTNVEGEQRTVPYKSHVAANGRCLCDTGYVLKKDTATGDYSCVDIHYNEVKR